MHLISIHLKNKTQINLFFKKAGEMSITLDMIEKTMLEQTFVKIMDDYNHRYIGNTSNIECVLYTDVAIEDDLKLEMSVLAKRFEIRCASHPILNAQTANLPHGAKFLGMNEH